MSILRSLAVVIVIGVVVAGLAGYRWSVQNRFTAEESLEDTFRTGPAPRVVVETFNGAVEVVTNTEPRVEARVTRRASGASKEVAEEGLDEIDVTMTQDGDTVRIVARRAVHAWGTGNRSAEAFVQVPAGTVLDLRTSNGRIKATGLMGDVSGQTSNGAIDVDGSRGELKLTTSNGPIKVVDARGRVELRTSNGAIDILKARGAVVHARTSNGAVRCEGTLAPGDHLFHTSSGAIVVGLPSDSQFHVDARTSNGRISTAFNVQKTGKPQKRRLQGQVGDDPTLTLKLETSNGSIDIRKQ